MANDPVVIQTHPECDAIIACVKEHFGLTPISSLKASAVSIYYEWNGQEKSWNKIRKSDAAPPPNLPPGRFDGQIIEVFKQTLDQALSPFDKQFGPHTGLWMYHNIKGEQVGAAVRWDPAKNKKVIRHFAKIEGGNWMYMDEAAGGLPSPRPLYNLHKLGVLTPVIVTEGEKTADAAADLGFASTTSAGGSKQPNLTDWTPLAGKEIWIFPDNDEAGEVYAQGVIQAVSQLRPKPVIKVMRLANLPPKGDLIDWIQSKPQTTPAALQTHIHRLARSTKPL